MWMIVSATIGSVPSAIRLHVSATIPASVFSIGKTPTSAEPSRTAAKTSANDPADVASIVGYNRSAASDVYDPAEPG
jgi:hypothetical protein